MDNISSSLDWQQLRIQIEQKISHLSYKIQEDLYIMLKNTDMLITELSIEEIECRRKRRPTKKFLTKLEEIIKSRKSKDENESYTAKLLNGPLRRIAQKVGEEGVETALASVTETDEKLIGESADLLFHLLVLLQAKGLELSDVVHELSKRHK